MTGSPLELLRRVVRAVRRAVAGVAGRWRALRHLVGTAVGLVHRADLALRRTEDLLQRAEAGVTLIEQTAAQATATVTEVRGVVLQARTQVEAVAAVTRAAEQVSPADVQKVLTTVQDLRQLVEGLPGVGFMRRRSEG